MFPGHYSSLFLSLYLSPSLPLGIEDHYVRAFGLAPSGDPSVLSAVRLLQMFGSLNAGWIGFYVCLGDALHGRLNRFKPPILSQRFKSAVQDRPVKMFLHTEITEE